MILLWMLASFQITTYLAIVKEGMFLVLKLTPYILDIDDTPNTIVHLTYVYSCIVYYLCLLFLKDMC